MLAFSKPRLEFKDVNGSIVLIALWENNPQIGSTATAGSTICIYLNVPEYVNRLHPTSR